MNQNQRTHIVPLRILESHIDHFGHVNHATYLQIFEAARWDCVTEKGYGLEVMQESGVSPVILKLQMNFKKEMRLRQEALIHTIFLVWDKNIGQIYQKITSEQCPLHCEVTLHYGYFDLKKRKLVPPPLGWKEAMKKSQDTSLG